MRLEIARAALAAIRQRAAADPDREVCGLLLGRGARVEAVVHAANVAADPARWFEVDPAALIAAHRAARAGGPAVIGHYHSHPTGLAAPSARDEAAALPGQIWLILGGDEAAAFHVAADGRFEPIALDPA